jgi:hypothetical protein
MFRPFLAARPLQASKLAVVAGVLVFGTLGFVRIVPDQQLTALLAVPFAGFVLALVVLGETLVAAARAVGADGPVTQWIAARPIYAVVRAVETVAALVAVGGIVGTIAMVPDGPMAGPGAIGLLFIVGGFGLLVLVASLVRTVTEWYLLSDTGR